MYRNVQVRVTSGEKNISISLFLSIEGEWDTNGFGIIAMTKADWNMIGGFDKKDFKGDQWGGEDWEMIDR